jgi:Lysozyme like domain/Peptidase M15
VAYRVRGYPMLQTARPQGTAAQLTQGRIDVQDVEPRLLSGLEKIGEWLKRPLTIFSGYRTPEYSASVGGFADDPHTEGRAVDVNLNGQPLGRVRGIGPHLAAQGLLSGNVPNFYKGKPDPSHIYIDTTGVVQTTTLGKTWIDAGGSPKLANIMAAIALAESGGRVDAKGGPNDDGSYDYGLWQINSSHTMYDPDRLMSDPDYNAHAAVSIEKTQGLSAWTTYKNGAYRNYLVGAGKHPVTGGKVRPGGGPPGGSDDDSEASLAAWHDYLNPTEPFGPLGPALGLHPIIPFGSVGKVIHSVEDFHKWVAWMFSPLHILRAVEFLVGTSLMMVGIVFSYRDSQRGGGRQFPRRKGGALGSVIKTAETVTPQGRAVKAAAKASRLAQAGEGTRKAALSEAKVKTEKARATELRTRGGRKGRPKKKGPIGFA